MEEQFEESVEYRPDDLMDHLERIAYAGQTIDERHEKILDRHWRYTDLHLNGTLGTVMFNKEVLSRVDFRRR